MHLLRSLSALCLFLLFVHAEAKVQKCKPRAKGPADSQQEAKGDAGDCAEETLLDSTSFDLYISPGSGVWLVFFGTTDRWCPYCQKLLPEWKQVSAKVSEDGPYGMGIARFDCTEADQKQFCHNHGVKKYPNIRLYSNGSFIEKYSGERSTGSIMEYINTKAKEMNIASDSASSSSSNPPSDKGTGNALPPMPKADGDASEKINLPPVPQLQQPPTPNLPPIPVNENDSRDVKKPSIENQDVKEPPFPKDEATTAATTTAAITNPTDLKQDENPKSTIKQASLIIPTTSLLSTLNIKLSKILSLIVILFGCYKLYQPFFAVRKPSVPLTTPFILDATASSLVFVYCLRNGFDISTYAELALFATTGIYIVLADWEFSINHDASKLRVMSVVFTLAIMTGMYALLPALLSECSPFVATGIIYLNRFVVQKRKPDVLPMLLRRGRKGVNLKVNGVVLDFAGLVIVSRVVTTWVEMKADVGVLCYYVVLGCIHIMGDKFFGSEGDGLKGSKMVD